MELKEQLMVFYKRRDKKQPQGTRRKYHGERKGIKVKQRSSL